MKILVPTKRVPDTDQRIRVAADGLGIDTSMLPFVVNPFDAIALEEAVRIGEESSQPVEVVAVGVGKYAPLLIQREHAPHGVEGRWHGMRLACQRQRIRRADIGQNQAGGGLAPKWGFPDNSVGRTHVAGPT